MWDSHGEAEFQPFTPQWNDATLDSIGGFILNLVLKSCYFDRDECREILGKKYVNTILNKLTILLESIVHTSCHGPWFLKHFKPPKIACVQMYI